MTLVLDDRIVLGEGPRTRVYHGTLDKESVAAKKTKNEAKLRQEAAFLSRCNHPNVVRMKGLVMLQDESYLVMELARGGNLNENLGQKKFSRAQKLSLVQQICFGLEHIHSLNILHRNIRAENLLLKDDHHLVIADFRMAQEYRGRPTFKNDAVYTFKSDVFLLALVVFQIFEDRRNVDRSTLAREIQEQSIAGGLNRAIFDVGRWEETLMNALHWKIDRRPTLTDFRQAFLDPQIDEHNYR